MLRTITVSDGRLTLSNPNQESYNKVAFIRIAEANTVPPGPRKVYVEVNDGSGPVDVEIQPSVGTGSVSGDGWIIDGFTNDHQLNVGFLLPAGGNG